MSHVVFRNEKDEVVGNGVVTLCNVKTDDLADYMSWSCDEVRVITCTHVLCELLNVKAANYIAMLGKTITAHVGAVAARHETRLEVLSVLHPDRQDLAILRLADGATWPTETKPDIVCRRTWGVDGIRFSSTGVDREPISRHGRTVEGLISFMPKGFDLLALTAEIPSNPGEGPRSGFSGSPVRVGSGELIGLWSGIFSPYVQRGSEKILKSRAVYVRL